MDMDQRLLWITLMILTKQLELEVALRRTKISSSNSNPCLATNTSFCPTSMLTKLQRATRKSSHVLYCNTVMGFLHNTRFTFTTFSFSDLALLLFLKKNLYQLLPGDTVEEDPGNPLEMIEGAGACRGL